MAQLMIPLGYLYKKVASRPEWLKAGQVNDIYSVGGHVSEDFTDYVDYWKHNGYWLFDSPYILAEVAKDASVSLEQQNRRHAYTSRMDPGFRP